MYKILRFFTLLFLLINTQNIFAKLVCEPLKLAEEKPTVSERHAKGLLWKIQRIGLEPSYIYGTMHLADKEITTLSVAVLNALDNAMTVTLEVDFNVNSLQEISKTMNYSDGTKLNEKIDADLYSDTVSLLKLYGFNEAMVSTLKPWSAYLALSMPPSKGGIPVDMIIHNRGKQFGAKMYGLESLQEQLGIFDKLSEQDQEQLLKDSVCNYKTFQADILEMKELYLKQNLAGLALITEKYEPDEKDRYKELMEDLIKNRNQVMVDRMQIRLIEGNAFIAVGALHLPGEKGILALLEQQGFIVTPIF